MLSLFEICQHKKALVVVAENVTSTRAFFVYPSWAISKNPSAIR